MKRMTAAAILAFALAMEVFGQGAMPGESAEGTRLGESSGGAMPEGPGKGAMLTGEAAIRGGYGHTDPYRANLKFNAASRTIDFKSYAGVTGITPYSSRQTEAELYTFTGAMPLSENAGNVYRSTLYTEASGVVPHYGFSLGYKPGGSHRFTLGFDGQNTSSRENGTLEEGLSVEGQDQIHTHWSQIGRAHV